MLTSRMFPQHPNYLRLRRWIGDEEMKDIMWSTWATMDDDKNIIIWHMSNNLLTFTPDNTVVINYDTFPTSSGVKRLNIMAPGVYHRDGKRHLFVTLHGTTTEVVRGTTIDMIDKIVITGGSND